MLNVALQRLQEQQQINASPSPSASPSVSPSPSLSPSVSPSPSIAGAACAASTSDVEISTEEKAIQCENLMDYEFHEDLIAQLYSKMFKLNNRVLELEKELGKKTDVTSLKFQIIG